MKRVPPSIITCLNESPLVDTFLPLGSFDSVRWLRTNVFPLSYSPSTATTAPCHPIGGGLPLPSGVLHGRPDSRCSCVASSSPRRNASENSIRQPSFDTSDSRSMFAIQSYMSHRLSLSPAPTDSRYRRASSSSACCSRRFSISSVMFPLRSSSFSVSSSSRSRLLSSS